MGGSGRKGKDGLWKAKFHLLTRRRRFARGLSEEREGGK